MHWFSFVATQTWHTKYFHTSANTRLALQSPKQVQLKDGKPIETNPSPLIPDMTNRDGIWNPLLQLCCWMKKHPTAIPCILPAQTHRSSRPCVPHKANWWTHLDCRADIAPQNRRTRCLQQHAKLLSLQSFLWFHEPKMSKLNRRGNLSSEHQTNETHKLLRSLNHVISQSDSKNLPQTRPTWQSPLKEQRKNLSR